MARFKFSDLQKIRQIAKFKSTPIFLRYTLLLKGNVAHFSRYLYEYYPNSLFTMSNLKAFDSKVAVRLVKCENFVKVHTCYRALLCCKRLPSPGLVFL